MQFHRGRLFDHVHLRVANVEASQRFYGAVLDALGLPGVLVAGPGHFFADELFVDKADGPVSHVHLAFQAASHEVVQAFHRAAVAAGGRDNGGPGERTVYHPGYYGAFILDPDGHNVEVVNHNR